MNPVHLGSPSGNPACGLRDVTARLTSDNRVVTCPRCRESKLYRARQRYRPQRGYEYVPRGVLPAVRNIRSDANRFLREALRRIEQLPVRAA